MVQYAQGSLFESPKGSTLVHAVNCRGVWGAGIALDFKSKFPEAFREYQNKSNKLGAACLGKSVYTKCSEYGILSLFTSEGFGRDASSPHEILEATADALDHATVYLRSGSILNMPKINAGLFRVPWEDTEKVLLKSQFNCKVWVP